MPKRKPFRVPERIVTLFFEDGPYQGLEVEVSLTAPSALFWTLAAFSERDDEDELSVRELREVALLYGGQIRNWNLVGPDGAPVPATPEAFADQLDQRTQGLLIGRWLEAVRTPPASLSPGPRKRRTSAQP